MSELTATDPAIDAAREALIATYTEDAAAEEGAAPEAVEASAPEAPADAAAAPKAEPPEAPVESSEPAEAEPDSRGYRRLLAREARLREEQQAFTAKRKEHEADLAAIAEWKKSKDSFQRDPVGYMRAQGLTQQQILATLQEAHITDLGDLAPADARAQLAAKRAERIAQDAEERLRAETERYSQQNTEREAQRFIAEYQSGITQFVGSELSAYPQLAAIAAAGKPVAQAMYQTAVEMASANPSGPAPSYKDVANQLNQQLAELLSAVSPAPTPTDPEATATPTRGANKPVLRNQATSTQPGPAPEPVGESYDQLRDRIRQQAYARHGVGT